MTIRAGSIAVWLCLLGCVLAQTAEAQTAPVYTVPSTGAPQGTQYTVPTQPAPYVPATAAYVPLGTPAPAPTTGAVAAPAPTTATPAPRRRGNPSLPFIIAGAALLGGGWVLNLIGGVFAGVHPFGGGAQPEWAPFRYASLIPVAGPWAQLALKPTQFDDDEWGFWLVLDGLLQGAGAILLIVAAVVAGNEGGDEETTPDLVVVPTVGPGSTGLMLAGRF